MTLRDRAVRAAGMLLLKANCVQQNDAGPQTVPVDRVVDIPATALIRIG